MNNHLEAGDLVATIYELENPNRPGELLPAGMLGIVNRVGPALVRIEIGQDMYIHVWPDTLTVVEKGAADNPAPAAVMLSTLWDLWAEAARRAHELDMRLTSAGADQQARPDIS